MNHKSVLQNKSEYYIFASLLNIWLNRQQLGFLIAAAAFNLSCWHGLRKAPLRPPGRSVKENAVIFMRVLTLGGAPRVPQLML